MNYIKEVSIEGMSGILIRSKVHEYFTADSGSIFTWPCALVLAAYLTANPMYVRNKRVIELGAGNALPSIVAVKLGAKQVFITEREEEELILNNLKQTIAENATGIELDSVKTEALDWSSLQDEYPRCDVGLGSDIFYSTEDFDNVLAVITTLLLQGTESFLVTYQERSDRRNIEPYLMKYNLEARNIPKESFLHEVHFHGLATFVSEITGTSSLTPSPCKATRRTLAADDDLIDLDLPSYSDIFLIEITLANEDIC